MVSNSCRFVRFRTVIFGSEYGDGIETIQILLDILGCSIRYLPDKIALTYGLDLPARLSECSKLSNSMTISVGSNLVGNLSGGNSGIYGSFFTVAVYNSSPSADRGGENIHSFIFCDGPSVRKATDLTFCSAKGRRAMGTVWFKGVMTWAKVTSLVCRF